VILVDTTVLIYAVGDEHPLRAPCRRVLAAHGDGRIEATTTVEALQEVAHVRARRRSRADAVTLARQYATAFALIVTQPEDLDLGLTLFEAHPALGAFDAVLAAVALNRHADALISADAAFADVPGLVWVDPASADLDQVLGS
jgi:uncharacterized protein